MDRFVFFKFLSYAKCKQKFYASSTTSHTAKYISLPSSSPSEIMSLRLMV